MGGSSRNGLKEVYGSLRYEKFTNFSQNFCQWRVNMLSSRLVGNEGNIILVAYGKCKCGMTPNV